MHSYYFFKPKKLKLCIFPLGLIESLDKKMSNKQSFQDKSIELYFGGKRNFFSFKIQKLQGFGIFPKCRIGNKVWKDVCFSFWTMVSCFVLPKIIFYFYDVYLLHHRLGFLVIFVKASYVSLCISLSYYIYTFLPPFDRTAVKGKHGTAKIFHNQIR